MMTNGRYYRRLVGGSLLIMGVLFLWVLAQAHSFHTALGAVFLTITRGIPMGAGIPGILVCVIASACLMGYGLVVRKRYALTLFWCGLVLFFLAGMMGMGTRY